MLDCSYAHARLVWLEEAFEERAAIFYRTGDSEPAEVFERLAATAANVPAVLMEQQQKLWGADAKDVARVWENVLNEIVSGDPECPCRC